MSLKELGLDIVDQCLYPLESSDSRYVSLGNDLSKLPLRCKESYSDTFGHDTRLPTCI